MKNASLEYYFNLLYIKSIETNLYIELVSDISGVSANTYNRNEKQEYI
eukprot:UN23105